MLNHWKIYDEFFVKNHQSLTRGVLFLGLFLVSLAVMIFVFPAFIGFIFAAFILFAGISALFLGFKFWKARDLFQEPARIPVAHSYRTYPRRYYRRTFFIVR